MTTETPVVFRKMTPRYGGDVVAMFPTEAASYTAHECGCYAHVGQHSSCEPWHIMRHSHPATPAEYADLKAELEAEPYRYHLRVYERIQPEWREVRRKALAREGGVKIPPCGCDEREEIVNRHARGV